MSAEENKAIIRRLFEEVYNGGNMDILDEIVAPGVFNHTAVPEHQCGIEGFKHIVRWGRNLFPDGRYEIEDMRAEGDKVACRVTVSGTHQGELWNISPTGKQFSVEHIHWHRLAGGKLVERWAVRDDLGMMQQLGVISMPG